MSEPSRQPDAEGQKFSVRTEDGDIIVISANQAPPSIPDNKARDCPQCGRRAWLLTRHCWHCGYDFGRRCSKALARLTFLAALANLAAVILLLLVAQARAA